jgi:hypothetical protein
MSGQQSSYQSGKSKLTLRVRPILATVIILIYGAACCLPALAFSRYYPGNASPPATDSWFGLATLGLGWMSLFFGCVAWLANLLFVLSLLFFLMGWRWLTVISSGLKLLLSLRGSFSQGAEHCINDCPEHEKESELWQPGHKNSSMMDDDNCDCAPRRMQLNSGPYLKTRVADEDLPINFGQANPTDRPAKTRRNDLE